MSNQYYPKNVPKVITVQSNSDIISIGMKLVFIIIISMILDFVLNLLKSKYIVDKSDPLNVWAVTYGQKYNDIFDARNVYDYEKLSTWQYYLKQQLFGTTAMNDLPISQMSDFITSVVKPHLYRKEPGEKFNDGRHFITPKHLCYSIQFSPEDNDADYETWLSNYKKSKKTDIIQVLNPLIWGTDSEEWRNRIAYWCGCTTKDQATKFWSKDTCDGKGQGASIWAIAPQKCGSKSMNPFSKQQILTNWFKTFNDGKSLVNSDNPFARYGISPYCPDIMNLGNDDIRATSAGEFNTRVAMLRCLGLNLETKQPIPQGSIGGWVAYFKYFGPKGDGRNANPGPISRLFDEEDLSGFLNNPFITPCPKVKKHHTDVGGIFAGIATAVAGAAMAVAMGPAGMAMESMIAMGVAGGAGGLVSATKSAVGSSKNVCKKDADN